MKPGPKPAKRPWIVRNWLVFMIIVILVASLCGLGVLAYLQYVESTEDDPNVKFVWMDRGAENDRIKELIGAGRSSDIVDFWAGYTKNRYNASSIMQAALTRDIPVITWFALVKSENWDFNPMAVSKSNEDGSVDLGMGQGNSRVYVSYTMEQMLDVDFNMGVLSDHLRDLYEGKDPTTHKAIRSAGSWDDALLFYNTGPYPKDDRVKLTSVHKLTKIYEWEREYSRAFWEKFYGGK